jgi:hypothetical protein
MALDVDPLHTHIIGTVLWSQEAPCTYLVALKLSPLAAGRYHLCRAGGTRHSFLWDLSEAWLFRTRRALLPCMRLVRSSAPIRKEVIHAYVIHVAATMFSLSRSQKKRRGENSGLGRGRVALVVVYQSPSPVLWITSPLSTQNYGLLFLLTL